MTTTVKVISAVYVPVGEFLNGKELASAQWLRKGDAADLSDAFALVQSQNGQVDIVQIDGSPSSRPACCC